MNLMSQEGDQFEVEVKVAKMSELVKTMIPEEADEDEEAQEIPLPNVKSHVLAKVIEFCRRYAEEPMSEIEKPLKSANMHEVVQEWYANYVDVDQELLFELIARGELHGHQAPAGFDLRHGGVDDQGQDAGGSATSSNLCPKTRPRCARHRPLRIEPSDSMHSPRRRRARHGETQA